MSEKVPEHTGPIEANGEAEHTAKKPSTLFPSISGKVRDFDSSIARHVLEPEQKELEPAARVLEPPGRVFRFTGTVKLHGAHMDIVVHQDGHTVCRSRNVEDLAPETDHYGFFAFISARQAAVSSFAAKLKARWLDLHSDAEIGAKPMIMAGEWIGEKIQRGVAISQLPKSFVLCSLNIADTWEAIESYAGIEESEHRIYNISRGGFFHVDFDFTVEGAAFLEQAKALTAQVCSRCPFGEALGAIGTGEGIVWTPTPDSGLPHTSDFWLKTKGDRFMKVSRGPKLPDPAKAEQLEKEKSFATEQCTDERLEQAWAYLLEMGIPRDKPGGNKYREWLVEDIEKEEKWEIGELGIGKTWKTHVGRIAKRSYDERMKQKEALPNCD
ncbi:uncharacterized protein AB675_10128 [Cyphellophora attinorum]|uniref:RNA ligase domain-containing protein n=1 Tax=Cyphellophora attinorum TaxID=1664694 RepID=A0A0N1HHF4_9EURO|nr:uncharacterized protein AB675_10128 [Phialophora attinorum]KPI35185.1 hypothetical protein AB675_10128 [Phialophora attinorum]